MSKTIARTVAALGALIFTPGALAATIFDDGFSGANGTAIDGYNGRTSTISGPASASASIENNAARLARGTTQTAGTMRINRTLSDQGPFDTTLDQSAGTVSYGITLDRLEFNPSGVFNWAYIVGATSADFFGSGSGYFLATQPAGASTDALMFGVYDGAGLGTAASSSGWDNATVLIATSFPTAGFNSGTGAVRLDYDPASDLWSLFANTDETIDPALLTSADLVGQVSNGLLVGQDMAHYGVAFDFGSASTSNRYFQFDNLSVKANAVPVPPVLYLLGSVLLLAAWRRRTA